MNIDNLLNLSKRWTREFKAKYAIQQNVLRKREARRSSSAQARQTLADIQSYVNEWELDLAHTVPHYEVHLTLIAALKELDRLTAWLSDLAQVTI